MPIISELASGEKGVISTGGSYDRREYIVECPADGDPRLAAGVPQRGQVLPGVVDENGVQMPCDSTEKISFIRRYTNSDSDELDVWSVGVTFKSPELVTPVSSDRVYDEWGVSFARESIPVPYFFKVPRLVAVPVPSELPPGSPPGTPLPPPQTRIDYKFEWVPRPYQLQITYMVYKQVVYIKDVEQRDLMRIRAQVGRIHYFGLDYGIVPLDSYVPNPTEWNRRKLPWLFQPPSIFMVKPRLYRIEYAWVNDPGNQAIVEDITENTIAPNLPRPPFWRYDVQVVSNAAPVGGGPPPPPELIQVTPVITAKPIYTQASGWIDPTGYLQLIGNPIGV